MNPRKYPRPPLPEARIKNESIDYSTWLRTNQAAAYIGTTRGGLYNMVWRGQLKFRKPFGRLLFKKADLDRLIEATPLERKVHDKANSKRRENSVSSPSRQA